MGHLTKTTSFKSSRCTGARSPGFTPLKIRSDVRARWKCWRAVDKLKQLRRQSSISPPNAQTRDSNMPYIQVRSPNGALNQQQREQLAANLTRRVLTGQRTAG